MAQAAQQLQSIIASALEAVGYELVGCEHLRQGGHSLLRVYIDQPSGVTADDCAKASRQIGSVLDVEDVIPGSYVLEVSSPGLDRPLYTKEHYQRFIGRTIKLRLRVPEENQRQFSGVLAELNGDKITLQTTAGPREFGLSKIEKANVVPEIFAKTKK